MPQFILCTCFTRIRRNQKTTAFHMFISQVCLHESWATGLKLRSSGKNLGPIAFPIILDRDPYAFELRPGYKYQFPAVKSYMGNLRESGGHGRRLIMVFSWWFRFDDTNFEVAEESATVQENFAQTEDSGQTASILFYMADSLTNGSINSSPINKYLFIS
jgi:hypothetical protein